LFALNGIKGDFIAANGTVSYSLNFSMTFFFYFSVMLLFEKHKLKLKYDLNAKT